MLLWLYVIDSPSFLIACTGSLKGLKEQVVYCTLFFPVLCLQQLDYVGSSGIVYDLDIG